MEETCEKRTNKDKKAAGYFSGNFIGSKVNARVWFALFTIAALEFCKAKYIRFEIKKWLRGVVQFGSEHFFAVFGWVFFDYLGLVRAVY